MTKRSLKTPSLESYIEDVTKSLDCEISVFLGNKSLWPIRELFAQLKCDGVNLTGLKPVKKDRRKICNRYKRKCIREAELKWERRGTR